ncbi:MAG TPA: NAD-dependent epimerase/dehydratase family protein [Intrasporangium sp.]|uniref:NAD-dependent epimerase/dehydratase family protein n=1 Tax=Intrasporangium sp. TaxID=1925024 RepID=UPI002B470C61|nr:NAD-dependent epimerase/dehydratase family protein [Intrasporangium sp.]HKX66567.1 NAD-dependent epimerase/dehydratase family protein [Intrasporangium sp.]
MRVTVIGGTGNVGSATVARLARDGHDVVAAARRLPRASRMGVLASWRRVDVTAPSAPEDLAALLRGSEVCVYAAWALQPMRRTQYQEHVGLQGLARTVDACRSEGVRHLVALSSTGAYSPGRDGSLVDESHPVKGNPACAYSRQKAAMEDVIAKAVNDVGRPAQSDPLLISWPRPTLVAQPAAAGSLGRIGVAPILPRRLLPHLPVMPLGRSAQLQVVHAEDVADAIARIIDTRLPGPVNLAAPDVLGPREIAAPLGGRPLLLPGKLLLHMTDALWTAHLWPLEGGWLHMAVEVPLIDTRRAERELGWQARHSGADTWRELVEAMASGLGGDTPATRPRSLLDDALRLVTAGPVTRRTRT